ncbi:NUDIX domain-containing protein [Magnetovibrio sp.]|uniref:NUDIX domain-containing protein n=1 Tax=Magnetovibrio sp. TaxID=2024836 RepID=UPI002F92C24C
MNSEPFPYTGVLAPANAAAVILVSEDGRYLMQRRDDIRGIFYPGHLGVFGGACDGDETYEQAAVRELEEELSLSLAGRLKYFTRMSFSFEPFGFGTVERVYYTATLTDQEIAAIRLGEGQGLELIEAAHMLRNERVAPYDSFVLWQHCNVHNSKVR